MGLVDNWEPEFMTIFVTWQLRVTLDSIRNSCRNSSWIWNTLAIRYFLFERGICLKINPDAVKVEFNHRIHWNVIIRLTNEILIKSKLIETVWNVICTTSTNWIKHYEWLDVFLAGEPWPVWPVRSFRQIQLTMFEKYSDEQSAGGIAHSSSLIRNHLSSLAQVMGLSKFWDGGVYEWT